LSSPANEAQGERRGHQRQSIDTSHANTSGGLVNLLSGLSSSGRVCDTRHMNPPAIARDKNHRFPAEIISHGVGLYFRFCLSYRDVEELLCARGIIVTYEAIRVRHEAH
jgi:hypothetical protein